MFTTILDQIFHMVWANVSQLASSKYLASLVAIVSCELSPSH